MKSRPPSGAARTAGWRVAGALGLCLVGALIARQRLHRKAAGIGPGAASGGSAAPRAALAPSPGPEPRKLEALKWRGRTPGGAVELVPLPAGREAPSADDGARPAGQSQAERRHRLAERRRAGSAATAPYPRSCRPAVELGAAFAERGTERILRPMPTGSVAIRLWQDRSGLFPGESATLTVEAEDGGHPVPFRVAAATLLSIPPSPDGPVGSVTFRDDGAPPDDAANDGVATAVVALPESTRTPAASFQVLTTLAAGGESTDVAFRLERAPEPAARFTGEVRDALDGGDVAFDLRVNVRSAGTYAITGHLYDGRHRGMALLTTTVPLEPGVRTVRLRAFGKLLRDLAVPAPWELRDVEGWAPDQGPLPPLAGPHRTAVYALSGLGGADGTAGQTER